MPRDGSGNFSRSVTPPNNGDVANATDYNSEQNDVATALSDSINKSGTKAFAANQPMAGFKLTGLGAGSAAGDSIRYEQVLPSVFQPFDADLTAIGALGYTSGTYMITKTAADTWALNTITAAGLALLDDAAASDQRTTLGLGTAALATIGTSGDTVPKNNTANTLSALQTVSVAGVGLRVVNTTDAASNQVAKFESDRATMAANDTGYVSFLLSDSAGNQDEFFRITWTGDNVTSASEAGSAYFGLVSGGSLSNRLWLEPASFSPFSNDGQALGKTNRGWADLHGATGFTLNIANGNAVITHSSGVFTVSTGDLRVTTAGSDATSVVTVGGTQTLTNKTLTSPTINGGTAQIATKISTETGGTLTSASDNTIVDLATAPTINDGVHAAGACIVLVNNTAASMTLTQDTGMTLRLHGTTTTGNRTIPARGVCTVLIDPGSNAEAICCGDVS